ncbi:HAD-IA family hydrolase [Angustibacter speluncae]
MNGAPTDVDAIVFDTGGTVFDWHSGVTAALAEAGARCGVEADWPAITRTWRRSSTDHVKAVTTERDGRMDEDMDDVLRATLATTLAEHRVAGMARESDALVRGWRRMPAWPDSAEGLAMLRTRFIVASFTILRTSTVVGSSRLNGVQWDAIFSCEFTGVYKTAPDSYANACRWLDVPPARVVLATTHNNDLVAAHDNGLRTAFIHRPDEWAGSPSPDPEPRPEADWVARDIIDLARQLGV